jgi:hypothetical protein
VFVMHDRKLSVRISVSCTQIRRVAEPSCVEERKFPEHQMFRRTRQMCNPKLRSMRDVQPEVTLNSGAQPEVMLDRGVQPEVTLDSG